MRTCHWRGCAGKAVSSSDPEARRPAGASPLSARGRDVPGAGEDSRVTAGPLRRGIRMKTAAYRTALSLLALAAASPALAQQADDHYSITVIGNRLAAEDTNASWSVIDEEALTRAQNGAAADLIARLPGVNVTQNGTLGGVTNLRIRGDRKSVVSGKSVSVRVDFGGRRIIKKKHRKKQQVKN